MFLKTYFKKYIIILQIKNQRQTGIIQSAGEELPQKHRVAPGTEGALSTDPGHLHVHIKWLQSQSQTKLKTSVFFPPCHTDYKSQVHHHIATNLEKEKTKTKQTLTWLKQLMLRPVKWLNG